MYDHRVCMCRLHTGEIVEYDMVSDDAEAHIRYPAFKPIGKDIIHSIGGHVQNPELLHEQYFYKRVSI